MSRTGPYFIIETTVPPIGRNFGFDVRRRAIRDENGRVMTFNDYLQAIRARFMLERCPWRHPRTGYDVENVPPHLVYIPEDYYA